MSGAAIRLVLAAFLLAAGLVAAALATFRAVITAPVEADSAPMITHAAWVARHGLDEREIEEAVERSPFNPDRRRPDRRYAAGEPDDEDTAPEPVPIGSAFRLVGTVVGAESPLALIAADGASRWVKLGGHLDGFELKSVARASATLSRGDSTLVLTLPRGTHE